MRGCETGVRDCETGVRDCETGVRGCETMVRGFMDGKPCFFRVSRKVLSGKNVS